MKRNAAIALCLCVMLFFAACGKKKNNNEPPNSEIDGFYSSSQIYEGGDSGQDKNVNISGLSVKNNGDNTVITLNFMKGSKAAGVDTGKISDVPHYTVRCLDAPYRMMVQFDHVTFWDYQDEFPGIEGEGIAADVFRPYTSTGEQKNGQTVYLFFQLNGESAYQVEEKSDTLTITLKNVTQKPEQKVWYVQSGIYYDWEKLVGKVELYPTLSSDLMKYQLISQPFNTQAEAEAFAADAKKKLSDLNLTDALTVKELTRGALPEYSVDNDMFANYASYQTGDKENTLPLLMGNGQYLCSTPDGSQMLFAKDVIIEQGDNIRYGTQLWTAEMSGKATHLDIGEFDALDMAAYSPDGKKLAVLNNTTTSTLEIYDFTTKERINLGEEGIGNDVATFAWDSNSNKVYVVAGDNGAFQLKTYDFSKGVGERVSVLGENPLDDKGSFQFHNGQLYYSSQSISSNGIDGTIYKVDMTNGKSTEVAKGINFAISPDGKTMAVVDVTDNSAFKDLKEDEYFPEGSKIKGLKLINLSDNQETRLLTNVDVTKFVWTADSSRLYYVLNETLDNAKENKYNYQLKSYTPADQKTADIAKLASDGIAVTKENNVLLLSCYVNDYFATYVLDVNSLHK